MAFDAVCDVTVHQSTGGHVHATLSVFVQMQPLDTVGSTQVYAVSPGTAQSNVYLSFHKATGRSWYAQRFQLQG